MKFEIEKKSLIKDTFRTALIRGKFDLEKKEYVEEKFTGNIEIENKQWEIGVIYGHSGTGKSTIAKTLFPNDFIQNYNYSAPSVIDDMPEKSIEEITKTFNIVGFSSPPSWLKPYGVLSNGEKMRVDIARAILEEKETIVFDEFTSVVDRNVAKIASFAIAKTIRKQNRKFIAVTCHEDVLDWLEPDWVFDTNSMTFFLLQNTNDQKLKLKSMSAKLINGKFLGNITI